MSNLVPSKGPKFQQTLLLTQKKKKKSTHQIDVIFLGNKLMLIFEEFFICI